MPAPWILLTLIALIGPVNDPPLTLTPTALVETEPVPSEGDAADDPAIWIHPTDPALSLVLGTDKKGGLNVFGLNGKRLQIVSDGAMPNNVDVLYGVPIKEGERADMAIAGTRRKGQFGVTIWRIDPATRTLSEFGPAPAFTVLDGGEPYGSCVYRSFTDGATYIFVSNKKGTVEQYRITATAPMPGITAQLVRTLQVGSQVEGMVADLDLGHLYVGEEDVAIWKYSAEPDGGSDRTAVAHVGEHNLAADIEGLTIYDAPDGQGYLIASSQGNHTFAVFDRTGANPFVATIDPQAGTIADLGETDGIDVTSAPTSAQFPRGLFVAQDGKAPNGRQNFKFFAWPDVAGPHLRIELKAPSRPK